MPNVRNTVRAHIGLQQGSLWSTLETALFATAKNGAVPSVDEGQFYFKIALLLSQHYFGRLENNLILD